MKPVGYPWEILTLELDRKIRSPHRGPDRSCSTPGGVSETGILIPYGTVRFASIAGALAGTHVLTVFDGRERLAQLGREILWKGAQAIQFD